MAGCCCHMPCITPPSSCSSHGCPIVNPAANLQLTTVALPVSRLLEGTRSTRQGGYWHSEFSGKVCSFRQIRELDGGFRCSSVQETTQRSQIVASGQRSSARDAALLDEEIMSVLTGGKVSRRRSKVSRGGWRTLEVVRDETVQEELEALFWDHSSSGRGASGRKGNGGNGKPGGLNEELLMEEKFEYVGSGKGTGDGGLDVMDKTDSSGGRKGRGGGGEEALASTSQTEKENDSRSAEGNSSEKFRRDLEKKLLRVTGTGVGVNGSTTLELEGTVSSSVNRGVGMEALVVEKDLSITTGETLKKGPQIELLPSRLVTQSKPKSPELTFPLSRRSVEVPISDKNDSEKEGLEKKDLEAKDREVKDSMTSVARLALHRSPRLAKFEQSTLAQELEIVREAQSAPPDLRRGVERGSEPKVEEVLKSARRLMRKKGSSSESRALLQQLVKDHPLNANVWVHYAQLERQTGNVGAARSRYEQSIQVFEYWRDYGVQFMRALQSWATLESQDGQEDVARKLFKRALKTANKVEQVEEEPLEGLVEAEVVCLHSWAMLEKRSGSWGKTRELLQRAESLQPKNAVVLQSRAIVEKAAHNWGLARRYFRRATEAAPTDAVCWQAWGVMEGELGNVTSMRELFTKSLVVSPSNIHTLQAWAHNEARLNTEESRQKARDLYRQCVNVAPEAVFAWQAWALLEQKAGKLEEARKLFKSGLQTRPADVACLQAFAVFERQSGNLRAARDVLGLALAADSSNAAVLQQAAEVEEELGHWELAKELYIRAGLVDRKGSRQRKDVFEKRKVVSRQESLPSNRNQFKKVKGNGERVREERGSSSSSSSVQIPLPHNSIKTTRLEGKWRRFRGDSKVLS